MEIKDCLKDEMKRLNRINNLLEKKTNTSVIVKDEYNIIKDNVLAMCEIAKTLQ